MGLGALLLKHPLGGSGAQDPSPTAQCLGDAAWAKCGTVQIGFSPFLHIEQSNPHIAHLVIVPWPQISSSICF